MSDAKGCFKYSCLGCLGVLAILAISVGLTALFAWHHSGKREVVDVAQAARDSLSTSQAHFAGGRPGRVVLVMRGAGFTLEPAAPGDGPGVEAHYDRTSYELTDSFTVQPDSSWTYRVTFRRTIPALQAALASLFSGGDEPTVKVLLPRDVPFALEADVRQGGLEGELGGLWLTDADLRFKQGGFSLSVGEPLREPLERLAIQGSMGGCELRRLGNASPHSLDIDCRMGGADVDLRGDWRCDSDVRLAIHMGGMSVTVPDGVETEGVLVDGGAGLRESHPEVPLPVLRFTTEQGMGEIDFSR